MALSYTNLAFQLGSALSTKHLTDAQFVKGTYVVVKDLAERDALTFDDMGDDGVITKGSLVYVQSEDTTYRYGGAVSGAPTWLKQTNTDGTYVPQLNTLPTAQEMGDLAGVIFQYSGEDKPDVTDTRGDKIKSGYFYKVVFNQELGTGTFAPQQVQRGMSTVNPTTTDAEKKQLLVDGYKLDVLEVDGQKYVAGGDYIPQLKALPDMALTDDGYIFQYVGETKTEGTLELHNGYFYKFIKGDGVAVTAHFEVIQTQNEVVANPDDFAEDTAEGITSIKIDDKDYYFKSTGDDIAYTQKRDATTVAVGGIAKGKNLKVDYKIETITDLLNQLLFPYVAPTGLSLISNVAFGTYEYGKVLTPTSFGAKWTAGSEAITNAKITYGADTLVDQVSPASNTNYTATNVPTIDGTTNITISGSITDGDTTLTATGTYTFTKRVYYKVSSDPQVAPTTGTEGNNINISYQKNTYIYFLCPDQTKTQIQQYATGQWNNVDTTYVGTTNLTLATGATVEYHAYRTPKMGVTDSGKFQIK